MITALRFPSGTAVVNCGNLPTGDLTALTVEGWWRVGAFSLVNRPLLLQYGTSGKAWGLLTTRDRRLYFVVWASGGVSVAHSASQVVRYTRWTHLAGTYNGAAIRVWLDGQEVTAVSRLSGGLVANVAQDMTIGGYISAASTGFVGGCSWCRVSDSIRLPGAVPGPDCPPSVDSHTVGQWHMSEGSGAVAANATGVSAYDGVISDAQWVTSEAGDRRRARPAGVGWGGGRGPSGLQLGVGNHG